MGYYRTQTREYLINEYLKHNIKSGQTNAYRRSISESSRFSKYWKKYKTISMPSDPKAVWEFEFQRNVTKLSFLILIYLYTQDDDVVSNYEKRSVDKILKRKSGFLNESDFDEILKFIDDLPSTPYVLKYINKHNINEKTFNKAFSTVRRLVFRDKKYIIVLNRLKNKFELM